MSSLQPFPSVLIPLPDGPSSPESCTSWPLLHQGLSCKPQNIPLKFEEDSHSNPLTCPHSESLLPSELYKSRLELPGFGGLGGSVELCRHPSSNHLVWGLRAGEWDRKVIKRKSDFSLQVTVWSLQMRLEGDSFLPATLHISPIKIVSLPPPCFLPSALIWVSRQACHTVLVDVSRQG